MLLLLLLLLRWWGVPGWTDTGNVTAAGKPIWEGCCHGCGTHTTVPFEPRQGNPMPRCRECYAKYTEKKARKQAKGKRGARGSSAGQQGSSMSAGASSSKAAQQCTDAPDVVAHDQAQS
jgi:CxxC-x17-CxxC domain-containing protein